jgi:hypothetical protein
MILFDRAQSASRDALWLFSFIRSSPTASVAGLSADPVEVPDDVNEDDEEIDYESLRTGSPAALAIVDKANDDLEKLTEAKKVRQTPTPVFLIFMHLQSEWFGLVSVPPKTSDHFFNSISFVGCLQGLPSSFRAASMPQNP